MKDRVALVVWLGIIAAGLTWAYHQPGPDDPKVVRKRNAELRAIVDFATSPAGRDYAEYEREQRELHLRLERELDGVDIEYRGPARRR